MDVSYWKESLLKWVNVTGILEESISDLSQLNDGRFIGRLLGLWRKKSDHGKGICKDEMNSIEGAHALQAFLKYEYPHYEFDLDAFQSQNEPEIIYVTSLLLFHCCLRKTDHSIIEKMNELPEEVQIVMKRFFERVLPEGNCITQKVLKDAVCKEGFSIRSAAFTYADSPKFNSPVFSPKCRHPLRDFFQSPAAKQQKFLDKQIQEIRRLKSELDTKNFENNYLQEELQAVQEQVKNLVSRCSELAQENKRLREKPIIIEVEEIPNTDQDIGLDNLKLLKDEISCLESYAASLREELSVAQDQNETLIHERNYLENRVKYVQEKLTHLEPHCETLERNLEAKELEARNLHEYIRELTNHIQSMKNENDVSIEWDYSDMPANISPVKDLGENMATTVIDIQLEEMKVENSVLKDELQTLLEAKEELIENRTILLSEKRNLGKLNEELKDKVLFLEGVQVELEAVKRNLDEANIQLNNLLHDKKILEERVIELESELGLKMSQINQLIIDLEEEKHSKGQLIQTYKEAQAEKDREILNLTHLLKNEISALETERDSLKNSLAAEVRLSESYKKDILLKEEQITKLLEEVQSLLLRVTELEDEKNLINTKLRTSEEQIRHLENENNLSSQAYETLRAENEVKILLAKSAYEEIILKLEGENKILLEEAVEQQKTWEEANRLHLKQIADLEQKCATDNNNILLQEEKIMGLFEDMEVLHNKISELEKERDSVLDQLRYSESQIKDLKNENMSLSKDFHAFREESETRTEHLKLKYEERIHKINGEKLALEDEHIALQKAQEESVKLHFNEILERGKKLELLMKDISIKEEQIAQLSNEINASHSKESELQEEANLTVEKLSNCLEQIKRLESENSSLLLACEAAKKENEEKVQHVTSLYDEKLQKLDYERLVLVEKYEAIQKAQEETIKNQCEQISEMESISKICANNISRKEEQIASLSEEIKFLQEQMLKLEDDRNLLVEKLRTSESVIEDVKMEYNSISQTCETIRAECEMNVQKMISSHEERVQKLNDEREGLLEENITLQNAQEEMNKLHENKIVQMEDQAQSYLKDLVSKEQQIINLSEELKIVRSQMSMLEREKTESIDILRNCEVQIASLTHTNESMKREHEGNMNQLKSSYEERIQKLEDESKVLLEGHISSYEERIQKLEDEKRALLEEHRTLQKIQEETIETNNIYLKEIVETKQKSDLYVLDISTKEQLIKTLSDETCMLRTQISALCEEGKSMANKLKITEEQLKNFEEENKSLSKNSEIIKSENERIMLSMKSSYEERSQKLEDKYRVLLEENITKQKAQDEANNLYAKEIAELYLQNTSKDKEIIQLSDEIKSLHNQISQIKEERNSASEKLKTSEIRIQDLERQNNLLIEISESVKKENQEELQEIKCSYEERIQKLNDQMNMLLQDNLVLQKAYEEDNSNSNKKAEMAKEIAKLSEENCVLSSTSQALKEENKSLSASILTLEVDNKELQMCNKSLNQTLEDFKIQSELATTQLRSSLEGVIAELQTEKAALSKELDIFKDQEKSLASKYKETIQEKENSIETLKNKYETLEKELANINLQKKALEVKLESTEMKLSESISNGNSFMEEHRKTIEKCEEHMGTLKETLEMKEEDISKLISEKETVQDMINCIEKKVASLYSKIFQTDRSPAVKDVVLYQLDPVVKIEKEVPVLGSVSTNKFEPQLWCDYDGHGNEAFKILSVCSENNSQIAEGFLTEEQFNSSGSHNLQVKGSTTQVVSSLNKMLSDIGKYVSENNKNYRTLEHKIELFANENSKMVSDIKDLKQKEAFKDRGVKNSMLEIENLKIENMKLTETCDNLKCEVSKLKDHLEKQNALASSLKMDSEVLRVRNRDLTEKLEEWEKLGLRIEEMYSKHLHAKQKCDIKLEQVISDKKQLEDKMKALYDVVKQTTRTHKKFFESTSDSEVCSLKMDVDSALVKVEEGFNKISGDLLDLTHSCLRVVEQNIEQQHVLIANQSKHNSSSLFNNRIKPESGRKCSSYPMEEVDFTSDHNCTLQIQIPTLHDKVHSLLNEVEVIFVKCKKLQVLCEDAKESVIDNECDLEDSLEIKFEGLKVAGSSDLMKETDQVDLQKLRKQVEELEEKNRILGDRLAVSDNMVQDLQVDLKGLKLVNKNLNDEKDRLVLMKDMLEQRIIDLQKNLHQFTISGESNSTEIEQMKEAYKALIDEKCKLQTKYSDLKIKFLENQKAYQLERENLKRSITCLQTVQSEKLESIRKQCEENIRAQYEIKLEKLRTQMKITYGEEIEKVKMRYAGHNDLREVCKSYAEKVTKSQADINELRSQVWDLSEKLLRAQEEKARLEKLLIEKDENVRRARQQLTELEKKAIHSKSATDIRVPPDTFERPKRPQHYNRVQDPNETIHQIEHVEESLTFVRRRRSTSVRMSVPSGDAFPPQDEDGEIFNNTYLADLKAGRCQLSNKGRLSELKFRNSLCPPHLKSSYPAETQYHDPREFDDDELKFGGVDENEDSLSTSCLLPGDKQKKTRGQTSYKKPGPPTPGKNGGRLSLQGLELGATPRSVLREHNESSASRRGVTPSRLKSLFSSKSSRRDENSPVTPRGRGLSFFRKPMKNRSHPL